MLDFKGGITSDQQVSTKEDKFEQQGNGERFGKVVFAFLASQKLD